MDVEVIALGGGAVLEVVLDPAEQRVHLAQLCQAGLRPGGRHLSCEPAERLLQPDHLGLGSDSHSTVTAQSQHSHSTVTAQSH